MPVRAWLTQFIAQGGMAGAAGGSAAEPTPSISDRADLGDAPGAAAPFAADPDPADSAGGWSPAREAFGHRPRLPEGLTAAEGIQTSAASILARAMDDAGVMPAPPTTAGEGEDNHGGSADELGVRARVVPGSSTPRRHLDSDEIEHLLTDPAPAADAAIVLDAHAALRDIEQALREIREQLEAAPISDSQVETTPSAPASEGAAALGQASSEAIEQLGADIARLAQVMDCGLDSIETTSARQTVELRDGVAQMFDALASRIDVADRRSADPAAEPVAEPSKPLAVCEVDGASASGAGARADAVADDVTAEPPSGAQSALPGPRAGQFGQRPPGDPSADPDWELFDDPPASAIGDAASAQATRTAPQTAARGPSDLLPSPAGEAGGPFWEAQAPNDADSELFDEPGPSVVEPTRDTFGAAAGADIEPADKPTFSPVEPEMEGGFEGSAGPDPEPDGAQTEPMPAWRALRGWPNPAGKPAARSFRLAWPPFGRTGKLRTRA